MEQHRVLADPAEAGPGGEVSLEERPGIDVGARLRSGRERGDQVGERAEPGLDDAVVVLAPRIPRDPGRPLGIALPW